LKGKGHEISDFNKVMNQMKSWHFEAMPKIEINYFAERMTKVGNDKDVKAFLNKLRLVHKGLEVLDELQGSEELP
jgi:Replication Fork Protection Component Swi3